MRQQPKTKEVLEGFLLSRLVVLFRLLQQLAVCNMRCTCCNRPSRATTDSDWSLINVKMDLHTANEAVIACCIFDMLHRKYTD